MSRTRQPAVFIAVLVFALSLLTPGFSPSQQPAQPQTPALRVTSGLLVVDVVVTDKAGQPLRNLTATDFTVLENGKPQKLTSFYPPLAAQAPAPASAPDLPPNVYTNRPEFLLPPGATTFLLIDSLNTPVRDQTFARLELLKFVGTQLKGGQRIAVLTLGQQLRVVQDFTDDPALLRAAIDSFKPESPTQLSVEDVQSKLPEFRPPSNSRGEVNPEQTYRVVNALRDFLTEQARVAVEDRVGRTLAAFQMIARAGAGHPGPKNLVWVSAGFPIVTLGKVIAYSAVAGGDRGQVYADKSFEEQVRRTSSLLADAQLSVYPVDARGLIGSQLADAGDAGVDSVGLLREGEAFAADVRAAGGAQLDTQAAMQRLADETGGRVFTNSNDIQNAVAISVSETADNYVLAYAPADTNWDGKFRRVEVRVNRPDAVTRHRSGYFATGFVAEKKKEDKKEREADLVSTMAMGAPPATAISFDARALVPDSISGKTKITVEFLINPTTLGPETKSDGSGRFDLSFHVAAYDEKGKLATSRDASVNAPLKTADFASVQQSGFPYRTEIELPPGRYRLRLAVRDNRTALLGSAEGALVLGK